MRTDHARRAARAVLARPVGSFTGPKHPVAVAVDAGSPEPATGHRLWRDFREEEKGAAHKSYARLMRILRTVTVALVVSVVASGQEIQVPAALPLPGPVPVSGKPSEAERYQLFTAAHTKLLEAEERANQISLGGSFAFLVLGDLVAGVGLGLWAANVNGARTPSNDLAYNIGLVGMVAGAVLTVIGFVDLGSTIRKKILAGREVDYWRDAMDFNR